MIDLDEHLEGIVAGDEVRFARWMSLAEPELRRSLRSFAGQVDVEAVLQEALLRVWQFAPRVTVDGRGNSLLRYGLRVARNLAIDEVRRAGRRAEVPQEEAPEPVMPEVSPPDPQLAALIAWCLERLPGSPRKALEARLAARGGASDHVLSAESGMKLNTFLKNVGRARRLLHACLVERGASPGWGTR
jgi:DNA-directed RNA polymerase specialized sigma24 family protein